MDCSTPGFPVHHQIPELTQTSVHWVSDAIQPSHPLSSPSPLAFNLSQHQSLFQRVSSLHQVDKGLEFQFLHQSFQWIFRTGFLWVWLVGFPCCPRDSLGAQENKVSHCFHCFPIYLPWCDETGFHGLSFLMLNLSQLFHSPLSLSSRGSSVLLSFLP